MVKNSIKVYARVKRGSDQSRAGKYDVCTKNDCQEITFRTGGRREYGFYANTKLKYRFCSIFEEHHTQSDVFDVIAKPVVNSVLEGYNGTVFAYGQTGSGKTYSITGASEYDTRGIIPRTIQHIFDHIENSTTVLYNIYVSYLEIYNEVGYDLLNPKHRVTRLEDMPRVTILEDAKGETHLRNLSVLSVASEREAMCLLFLGDTNRTIAETPMNLYSSRSHCIFTIHVAATMAEDGRVRRSKLHLVDLAGSERIQKTGISGSLLVDAKQINLSLHYLEQVIIALSDTKRAHVPYRNSMMTTVLRDSLGGNCLTAMLATLSIEPKNFGETVSTCKFAQRVALVHTEAIINEEEDPQLEVSRLKLEIEHLKKELALYKGRHSPRINRLNMSQDAPNLPLTPNQIRECESRIEHYIKSQSDKLPIDSDIKKIEICFKIFKRIILSQQNTEPKCENISLLQNMINKKNNEISILINQLGTKKSFKLNQDKEMDADSTTANEIAEPNLTNGGQFRFKKALNAFYTFLRKSNYSSEMIKCDTACKERYEIANRLINKISEHKTKILAITKQLRMATNVPLEITTKLQSQLRLEQVSYKEAIYHINKINKEIQHLEHGFKQSELRLVQRFEEWYNNEIKIDSNLTPALKQNMNYEKPRDNSHDCTSLFSENNLPEISDLPADLPSYHDDNINYYGSETNTQHSGYSTEYQPFYRNNIPTTSAGDCHPTFINKSVSNPGYYNNQSGNPQPMSYNAVPKPDVTSNQMRPPLPYQSSPFSDQNIERKNEITGRYDPSSYSLPKPVGHVTNNQMQVPLSRLTIPESFPDQNFERQPEITGQYNVPNYSLPKPIDHGSNNQMRVPLSRLTIPGSFSGQNIERQSEIIYQYDVSPVVNATQRNYSYSDDRWQYDVPEKLNNDQEKQTQFINAQTEVVTRVLPVEVYVDEVNTSQGNIPYVNTNEESNHIEDDSEFFKSIPLTQDPEVDAEIIKFYRQKYKYNKL